MWREPLEFEQALLVIKRGLKAARLPNVADLPGMEM
jgi:hypothetical protein